jgi:hypothetical protein
MMAGAIGEEIDLVSRTLVQLGKVRIDLAEKALFDLRNH